MEIGNSCGDRKDSSYRDKTVHVETGKTVHVEIGNSCGDRKFMWR